MPPCDPLRPRNDDRGGATPHQKLKPRMSLPVEPGKRPSTKVVGLASPGRPHTAGVVAPRCNRSSSIRSRLCLRSPLEPSPSASPWWGRRSSPGVLRTSSPATSGRCFAARRCGASSLVNPAPGSDLAGLITRAELDGDAWVVNGQKVWTSMAQHSEWGILLARTDRAAPKHRGISYFLVDMKSEGVEVRPLRQIDGVAHFNEVFLTDVRIPANQIVGDVDNGWRVAQTTLQSERVAIGSGEGLRFADVRALLAGIGAGQSSRYRQQIASAFIRFELLRYLGLRVQTAISQGRPPGAESSVMKLAFSEHIAALTDLLLGLEGAAGMLGSEAAPDNGFWQQHFLSQWSIRIGGGTDQIQRNIISERVLGLPREPTPERVANPTGTS